MELRAVLETLRYFKNPSNLKIITDSQYVIGNITSGSAENAVKNNDLAKPNIDL